MGFQSSPYNCIRMSLIAEEIIQGDRHDQTNAFQWDSVMLNLPGSRGYTPSQAWITKRRANNSLASNFICFMDDERVTGRGSVRVKEGGHAISTRESYLGLQDALRKVRHDRGTTTPGAWAGVNVCIEKDVGIILTSSQDKWDQMKAICTHWLSVIASGQSELDFKRLQSDQGFLVYATQAYPGMKPYLKGFHLSLETWQGKRDMKGWKQERESKRNRMRRGWT